jgi:hypothetical protein
MCLLLLPTGFGNAASQESKASRPEPSSRGARRGPEPRVERQAQRRGLDAGKTITKTVGPRSQPRLKEMRVLMSRCSLPGAHALRAKLKSLQNKSQLLSLEVWGDSKKYRPGQKVSFFFRSPRPSFVTLFWLGPQSDVLIPLRNVRIPANQDVKIDSGGVIVPPLGREEWVAINTLERVRFPCYTGERAVLQKLNGMESLPHGVGHWVVDSSL